MIKYAVIIISALVLSVAMFNNFSLAQTQTPVPTGAPQTGLGWNK